MIIGGAGAIHRKRRRTRISYYKHKTHRVQQLRRKCHYKIHTSNRKSCKRVRRRRGRSRARTYSLIIIMWKRENFKIWKINNLAINKNKVITHHIRTLPARASSSRRRTSTMICSLTRNSSLVSLKATALKAARNATTCTTTYPQNRRWARTRVCWRSWTTPSRGIRGRYRGTMKCPSKRIIVSN